MCDGNEEIKQIEKKIGPFRDNLFVRHLSSKAMVLDYIHNADLMASYMKKGDNVLDWGCGTGQMIWLLQRRQFDLHGYDVEKHELFDALELAKGRHVVFDPNGGKLPFPDKHFDAVLSSGVLEHVPDERKAMEEIKRVLKPGGYLFIFMLPQKYSWAEWISRRGGYSAHNRLYTISGIKGFLNSYGFEAVRTFKNNLLPKNLTFVPLSLRKIYSLIGFFIYKLDQILSSVPVVNNIAGVIGIVCRLK